MSTGMASYIRKRLHAYVIAFIGFLISLGLYYALQLQEKRHVFNIAQLGIETIDNNIKSELAFDANLLKHINSQASKGHITKTVGQDNVLDILAAYPKLYALGMADAELNLEWLTAKDRSINHELIVKFIHEHAVALSTSTSIWVSSPLNLSKEDSAFLMVMPYSRPDHRTNYAIALIDTESLIQHNARLPGMSFSVYIDRQPIVPAEPLPRMMSATLFKVTQTLYGALWEIKAQETRKGIGKIFLMNYEVSLPWVTFILGIFISILVAKGVALSDLLEERAVSLDKINHDLKNEIAERALTEESKKNLEKALLQGQKLQAIGTLAGGIAHDFNNILYAIRGYVELAREDVSQEGITYKNLGKVLEGTQRGQELIAQILAFSRRQHHNFSPLKLKEEINGALILLHAAVPESVEIQFESTTEGPILGNKTQIHQVIVNLINNAVDAMDSEGVIRIELSHIAAGDSMLKKFPEFNMQNYCKIEIRDTGHGMDQTTMQRIFEPFYTTKEVGRGTGLGLSTAHSIIKDHHGEIIVNSQVGQGTTFTVFIPEYLESKEDKNHG